jgi:hypothetical protein
LYPDSFDASDKSIMHPSSEVLECTPDSVVGKVDLSVDADISTLQANLHGVPNVNGGIYSFICFSIFISCIFSKFACFSIFG